jgi:hypothetical protein
MGEKKCVHVYSMLGDTEDYLGGRDFDGRIILKWVLRKYVVAIQIRSS